MEGVHRNPTAMARWPGGDSAAGSRAPIPGRADDGRVPGSGDDIVRHVPYLRRYARALSGSQESGDQYVRVCLEVLVEEPDRLRPGPPLRLQLYRLFHRTWQGVAQQIHRDDLSVGSADSRFQAHLGKLPSRRREVLLLTAVEGFSLDEAAAILDIAPGEADKELVAARVELNDQAATSVLIIEDEPIIAFDLGDIVAEMGHDVVGVATTKDEAVSLAASKRPGIILADIQLSDGSSGIDAVSEILQSRDVPVVFVTAYPERLLTGTHREPAYLVTKPFEPDVLRVTIYQALLSPKKPPIPSALC